MTPDEIRTVGVIGAGLMGHGIALEFALAGLDVRLHDISREKLGEAISNIRKDFSMLIAADLIKQQQADAALQHIYPSLTLEEVATDVDVVVEAVFENIELKRSIFSKLDAMCPPRTILSSNTSTLLPSSLASATRRPDKVLVTHYFNPPFLLPLVEVVKGEQTSDETIAVTIEFLKKVGKSPALVRKEVPGFIGNRLQMALLREALSLVEQGVASPQDIDVVIKNSFGRRLSAAGVAVITGEGCLDKSTLEGKLPSIVALRARQLGITVIGRFGCRGEGWEIATQSFDEVMFEVDTSSHR